MASDKKNSGRPSASESLGAASNSAGKAASSASQAIASGVSAAVADPGAAATAVGDAAWDAVTNPGETALAGLTAASDASMAISQWHAKAFSFMPKFGLPSSHHFDPVLGIDIHIHLLPMPVPIPDPFIGIVFDWMDYLGDVLGAIQALTASSEGEAPAPEAGEGAGGGGDYPDFGEAESGGDEGGEPPAQSIMDIAKTMLQTTVTANGRYRTMAGSTSKNPLHLPVPPWGQPMVNTGESFLGSASVLVETEPYSYMALPHLTCSIVGMPSIPRLKGRPKMSLMLPTSFQLPFPTARPVMVGGPPIISLMGLFMGAAFKALGKLAKVAGRALKKGAKKAGKKAKSRACKLFGPCRKGNPVIYATGQAFRDDEDFFIPGTIPIAMTRYHDGSVWRHSQVGKHWIDSFSRWIDVGRGVYTYYDGSLEAAKFFAPDAEEELVANAKYRDGRLFLRGGVAHVRHADGLIYVFGQEVPDSDRLRLSAIIDDNGNKVAFSYIIHPEYKTLCLSKITSSDGFYLDVTTNGAGFYTSFTLHDSSLSEPLVVAEYGYDEQGSLNWVKRPEGEFHTYKYTSKRKIYETENSEGHRTTYVYDAVDRIIQIKTSSGHNQFKFDYTENDKRIVTVTNGDGHSTKFYVSANDITLAEEDAYGNLTRYKYDDGESLIKITDPLWRSLEQAWDEWDQPLVLGAFDGSARRFARDSLGRATEITDPGGAKWQLFYDKRGNLEALSGPLGAGMRLQSNAQGLVTKISENGGGETKFKYDRQHRLVERQESDGAVYRYKYDVLGNLSRLTYPDGGLSVFDYDKAGRLTRAKLCDGRELFWTYNTLGNVLTHTDGEGHTTKYEYGQYDLLKQMRDAKGNPIAFDYDDEGRLIGLTNAASEVYRLIRDKVGNVVEEVDFAGRRQFYGYDTVDRLVERVAPNGTMTRLEYDDVDQLTKATVYDGAELDDLALAYETRLVEADIPTPLPLAPRETTYAYDIDGQLVEAATKQVAIALQYDDLGRVTTETQTDLATGQETALESRYSLRGRVGFSPGIGSGQLVSYDEQGRPMALQIGEAKPLQFAYNKRGQEILRGVAGRFASTSAYSKVGELIDQKLFGGGQALSDAKATLGLDQPIKRYGSQTPSKTVGDDQLKNRRTYSYDRNSSPTEIVDKLLGTASYKTDQNGQVIQAQHRFGKGAAVDEKFAYSSTQDLIGKGLAGQNLPSGLEQKLANSAGEIQRAEPILKDRSRIQKVGPYLTYRYDAAGRVLERREEKPGFRPHIQHYTWNGSDQMIGAKIERNGKQEEWAYTYDALGRRFAKARTDKNDVSSTEAKRSGEQSARAVHYLWDGNALVAEQKLYADGTKASTVWHYTTDSDFTPIAREQVSATTPPTVSSTGTPTAWNGEHLPPGNYADEVNAQVPIGAANEEHERNIHYLGADHLGTIREATNHEGKVIWAASYRLWGEELNLRHTFANDDAANDFQPFRFPGQQFDLETQLYYNRFRSYDSQVGSYLCSDPIGLEGGSKSWGYVPSPLAWVDWLGLTGIIYLRTDPITGEKYVGKSKNPSSFKRRQSSHNSKLRKANNRKGDRSLQYDFEILEEDVKGKDKLAFREETNIRENGGIKKDGGKLENKIHGMKDEKYKKMGGDMDELGNKKKPPGC